MLALALLATLLAEQPRGGGAIRICRQPGVQELRDRVTTPIPAGTVFVSASDRYGDQLKPFFEVETTADVVLPPKPGCVQAPVRFKENPDRFVLTPGYPAPLPSQLNVTGLSIEARVIREVR